MSEFFVAPLSKHVMERARSMYDTYIKTFQTSSSSAASAGPTSGSNIGMTSATLAKLMEDLGVPTTESDARALIFSLSQSAAAQIAAEEAAIRSRALAAQMQKQMQEQQLQQSQHHQSGGGKRGGGAAKSRARAPSIDRGAGGGAGGSRRSSLSQPGLGIGAGGGDAALFLAGGGGGGSAGGVAGGSSSQSLTLSFEMFLRVLQMPFKALREVEMQQLWAELDRDKDGALSVADLAASMRKFNSLVAGAVPREATDSRQQREQRNGNNDDDDDENDGGDGGDAVAEMHEDPATVTTRKQHPHERQEQQSNKTALSRSMQSLKTTAGAKQQSKTSAAASPKQHQQQQHHSSLTAQELFQSPWMLDDLTEKQLEELLHELDADGDSLVTFGDLSNSLLNA